MFFSLLFLAINAVVDKIYAFVIIEKDSLEVDTLSANPDEVCKDIFKKWKVSSNKNNPSSDNWNAKEYFSWE